MKKSIQNHSIARQKMRKISVQKTLLKLLGENQISDIEKIYGIYPYEKFYDRHGIIVDVKEKEILNFAWGIWGDAINVVTTIIDIWDEVFPESNKVA